MPQKIRLIIEMARNEKITLRAASLAYYAMFALAPLLIIAVSIGNLFIENTLVRDAVSGYVMSRFGESAVVFFQTMIDRLASVEQNITLTSISAIILVFGIARFFHHARQSFFDLFSYEIHERDPLKRTIKTHGLSVVFMVAVIILFFSLSVFNITVPLLVQFSHEVLTFLPDALFITAQFAMSFLALGLLFTVVYRLASVSDIGWLQCFYGGLTAAACVTFLNYIISLFLQWSTTVSIYGAAEFLLVALIWVYYAILSAFVGALLAKAK
ncbi:MAG: YihY/virulence factor BrkB family protein [bacterium]|nr:YihY/virulence factor BrkB family protein [bacterium]